MCQPAQDDVCYWGVRVASVALAKYVESEREHQQATHAVWRSAATFSSTAAFGSGNCDAGK